MRDHTRLSPWTRTGSCRLLGPALAGLTAVLAGCDGLLDVDPEVHVDAELAVQTGEDVENALTGAYTRIQMNPVYGSYHNVIAELMGNGEEHLIFSGTWDGMMEIYNKDQVPSNEFVTRMWIDAYSAVNAANVVVVNADLVDDPAQRDRVVGEALFIRGISKLHLARFFAPPWQAGSPEEALGIPLPIEPTDAIREEIFLERASLAETYGRIIDDLTQAEALLPEAPYREGRATTYAASAFLAQVYLEQSRYQEAGEAANRVIEEGPYELVASYADAFNNSENSPEDIFAIQQSETSQPGGGGGNVTQYASLEGDVGLADMDIQEGHLAVYEDGDERSDLYYEGVGRKPGIPRSGKWTARFAVIPIIRLAEMHLTRAEANLRTGAGIGPNEPLEDVNLVRERASVPALSEVTVDDVLAERRLELAWEGNRLRDILRTQGSIEHGGEVFAFDHPKLVLPIPQRELDTNPDLEQNPGY